MKRLWPLPLLLAVLVAAPLVAQTPAGGFRAVVNGPALADGTEVDCDLPNERHLKNVGGSDGAGLCVFTSIGHAADWCNESALIDFQRWMRSRPGGGYPDKVTRMIREKCQAAGVPEPPYIQDQSGDLGLLALAVQRGHMASVTYGISPTGRYGGSRIGHMVNCVAARAGPQKLWAVLDNNYPGTIEWMAEDDFKRAYTSGGGGWCVILLRAGPPPPPRN